MQILHGLPSSLTRAGLESSGLNALAIRMLTFIMPFWVCGRLCMCG